MNIKGPLAGIGVAVCAILSWLWYWEARLEPVFYLSMGLSILTLIMIIRNKDLMS